MKLNQNQKTTLYGCLAVIISSFVIWTIYGGEVFTKTEVLIEIEDELFGTTKEWKEQFIWGLDLTFVISAAAILISAVIMFFQRSKQGKK